VTSENGVTTEEIMYTPFGEQLNETEERYTYNGKELDETGLYYYGARYYDPVIGRFVTRDPLTGGRKSPQTLNRYAYCRNNPLRYFDPAGTDDEDSQKKVEDVFARLQNINPDALKEIQELLDSKDISAVQALEMILELLGFTVTALGGNDLSVVIDDGQSITVKAVTSLIVNGQEAWGVVTPDGIRINTSSGKVGDFTLTMLHEISHVAIPGNDQNTEHPFIWGVEYSYFVALSWVGVEFSNEDIREGGKWNFALHVHAEVQDSDRGGLHRVSLDQILRRWIEGSLPC
jgi:RHS repeat-associated protein